MDRFKSLNFSDAAEMSGVAAVAVAVGGLWSWWAVLLVTGIYLTLVGVFNS